MDEDRGMTLRRLNQYRDQRRELNRLEKEIGSATSGPGRAAADTVRASMPEFPYTAHRVLIQGMDERHAKALRRRVAIWEARRDRLAADCLEIEEWIAGLGDSKLRQIIGLRFLQGYSWRRAAAKVYGAPGYEDAAKKRVYRFFETCPDCPDSPQYNASRSK